MNHFEVLKFTKYCCMHNGCNREYTTKINLKRHVLITHLDTQRFTCEQCQKSFSSKQNLIEHRFLHSGDKPYTCSKCNQKFRHLSSLSLHNKFHTSEQEMQTKVSSRFFNRETQTNH